MLGTVLWANVLFAVTDGIIKDNVLQMCRGFVCLSREREREKIAIMVFFDGMINAFLVIFFTNKN